MKTGDCGWCTTVEPVVGDPWDERLDALHARQVLESLAVPHRAALTLR